MKQKVLIVALAAVCLAVTGSTVTLSYFTDTSEVTNSFSIGKTDVEFFRWYSPISRYYNSDEAPGVNQRYENWLSASSNMLVGGKSVSVSNKVDSHYSGTLTIPETVLHEGRTYDIVGIGENAFNGDTQLEHVVLPGTIYSIDYAAFQGCSSLKTINFEQGLDSIASLAFDGCDALETIDCQPIVPPIMVSKNCFTMAAYDNAILRVPNESIRLYHESERWSEFYNIVRMESIEQGDANGDFKVDVSDIAALIDYITGTNTDNINSMLMDLNYDGDVTIADVTILIDTVLNSPN